MHPFAEPSEHAVHAATDVTPVMSLHAAHTSAAPFPFFQKPSAAQPLTRLVEALVQVYVALATALLTVVQSVHTSAVPLISCQKPATQPWIPG